MIEGVEAIEGTSLDHLDSLDSLGYFELGPAGRVGALSLCRMPSFSANFT